MKKIYFGVYKLKNIIINSMIALLLTVVSLVAFLGNDPVAPASVKNGAYYKGSSESGAVSLMVNVYWGTEYIEDMLEIFEEKEVKTTFFIGGIWLLENQALVEKIFEQGHEIANHGYKHKEQDKISYDVAKEEMETTHNLVKKLVDVDMTLFAPPSGAYNDQTIDIAQSMNYKTVMWSKDTIDWRDQDADLIFKRATKDISSGDLILTHPTAKTVEALPRIIETIQAEGLKILPVSQVL